MSDSNFSSSPSTPAASLSGELTGFKSAQTMITIFFEPARTFEELRRRPRFLVAGLIIIALSVAVNALFFQKIDVEQLMREQLERSPRTAGMSATEKEQAIRMQTGPLGRTVVIASPIIATAVVTAAGALLYLLGAMILGVSMPYKKALSIWVYSSFPPVLLLSVLSIVVLLLKPPDEIDLSRAGAGLVTTNLSWLLGPDAPSFLVILLASLDLFALYGLFLAAVGMRKMADLSRSSAWAVVLTLWGLGIASKVAMTALFG